MSNPNFLILMADQLNGTLCPDGPADWLQTPDLKKLAGEMHFVGPDQPHGFEQRLTPTNSLTRQTTRNVVEDNQPFPRGE